MPVLEPIDVAFDIRSDANGRDPDSHSATLRRMHQLVWTKALPSGDVFSLVDAGPRGYLTHGSLALASDQIICSFSAWDLMRPVLAGVQADDVDELERRGSTIGGTILFPGARRDGRHTINQARGVHPRIRDRFDLTLECIRRHYAREPSPLEATLDRYADFFALFESFAGYVSFFLLQDLVLDDGSVKFFTEWVDFTTPAFPPSVEEYGAYRSASLAFVDGRNARIAAITL